MASFSRFVRSGKYASGPHETDRAVATCATKVWIAPPGFTADYAMYTS